MSVEDMIRFALIHGPEAAEEIERLCAQHGWLNEGLLEDGTRVVPFARWAQVCAALGRGGVGALRPMLADPELETFAIAVLEDVRSADSVEALLGFCASADWQSPNATHADWKALAALNLLLSFDDAVKIEKSVMDDLLRAVVRAFDVTQVPFLKSLCLMAVRGAPTEAALAWVLQLEAPVEVEAARANALKSLKRRSSPKHKTPDAAQKRQVQRKRAADA
ncbi:hypothetical protein [Variovorax boronicumulans]